MLELLLLVALSLLLWVLQNTLAWNARPVACTSATPSDEGGMGHVHVPTTCSEPCPPGLKGGGGSPEDVLRIATQDPAQLIAISMGAVFFGAMTYIGNGPNFMVKSVAMQFRANPPSFFGYIFRYALPILLPVLVLVGWLFLR